MDCEAKKVFENSKYHEYRVPTAIICLGCTHYTRKDNFMQRVPYEEIKSVPRWERFKNWAKNGFS